MSVGYASIKPINDTMAILNIQILCEHQFNVSRNYILSQSGYISMLPETCIHTELSTKLYT
jgi:hypothetical protein